MSDKDTGGPAYPIACPEMVIDGQSVTETQGMTLRDYFAGQVLKSGIFDATIMAEYAYKVADAMIKERNK